MLALMATTAALLGGGAGLPDLDVRDARIHGCEKLGSCLSVKVRNRGTATAHRVAVRFYASWDERRSRDDRRIADWFEFPRVRPGRSVERIMDFRTSAMTRRHLVACVDPDRRIRESDERDNCTLVR